MSIQHPVFLRRVKEGKVIVITVMDEETLNLPEGMTEDCFGIATTSNNIYTDGKPQMKINTVVSSDQYVKDISDQMGYEVEHPRGQGVNGILRGPYWCIIPMKTVEDIMGG